MTPGGITVVEFKQTAVVPVEHITQSILVLRGHRVLLDTELAALYGVSTKRFNEQVRRNRARFPADFMFQLTDEELSSLVAEAIAETGVSDPKGMGQVMKVVNPQIQGRAEGGRVAAEVRRQLTT